MGGDIATEEFISGGNITPDLSVGDIKGQNPFIRSSRREGERRKGAACATGSGKSRQPAKVLDRFFFICYNKNRKGRTSNGYARRKFLVIM